MAGGDAERLYARAGWQRVGAIPNYALMPDGTPCATTVLYKAIDRQEDCAARVPWKNASSKTE